MPRPSPPSVDAAPAPVQDERSPLLAPPPGHAAPGAAHTDRIRARALAFVLLGVFVQAMANSVMGMYAVQYIRFLLCGAFYARQPPDPAPTAPRPELCYAPLFEQAFATQLKHWSLLLNVMSSAAVPILSRFLRTLTPKWMAVLTMALLATPLMAALVLPLAPPVVPMRGWLSPAASVRALTAAYLVTGLSGTSAMVLAASHILMVDISTPATLATLLNHRLSASLAGTLIGALIASVFNVLLPIAENKMQGGEGLRISSIKAPLALGCLLWFIGVGILSLTPQPPAIVSADSDSHNAGEPPSPERKSILRLLSKFLRPLRAFLPHRSVSGAPGLDWTVTLLALVFAGQTLSTDCQAQIPEYLLYLRFSPSQVTWLVLVLSTLFRISYLQFGVPALQSCVTKWLRLPDKTPQPGPVSEPVRATHESQPDILLLPEEPTATASHDHLASLAAGMVTSTKPQIDRTRAEDNADERQVGRSSDDANAQHEQQERAVDEDMRTQCVSLSMMRTQIFLSAVSQWIMAVGFNYGMEWLAIAGYEGNVVQTGIVSSLEAAGIAHLRMTGAPTSASDNLISSLRFLESFASIGTNWFAMTLYSHFIVLAPGAVFAVGAGVLTLAIVLVPWYRPSSLRTCQPA